MPRRVVSAAGFNNVYNFILWFVFCGALMGFVLARLQYLDIDRVFCGGGSKGAGPGECYFYRPGSFVPVIRHRLILFHRLNGHVVILLVLISNVGALIIARHAFGGDLATQTVVGFLAILTTGSLAISYINIKRLQIDQHRAFMLRAWFYLGSIITTRLIMIVSALVISSTSPPYAQARPCMQVLETLNYDQAAVLARYPDCGAAFNGTDPGRLVLVLANFKGGHTEELGVALAVPFGAALWLALAIHAAGVEMYLGLTPREGRRLRTVAYQRQLEAGMEKPGSAGLTPQRLGDADEWTPYEYHTTLENVAVGVGPGYVH
ncbi:hypothetical protein HDU90_002349 [Geranomyces variabilis]|nr:hypothetical protein HDU90_002349 [Geranomyces variabilis]